MHHTMCLQVAVFQQGSDALYRDLMQQMERSLGLFEQLCSASIFQIPTTALGTIVSHIFIACKQNLSAEPFMH